MKRRDFLKAAVTSSAALSIPSGLPELISICESAAVPDLVVSTGRSPAKITRAAVNALGGMPHFISKGDTVAIKPNIGWDRAPEYAANTNPEVIAEVIRMCYESGAKKVALFDRPVNDPRRCYMQSGISEAARAAGAEVTFIDERRFRDTKINGEAIKSWPLYEPLLAADKIINIPIAKHHGLSKLTMSMKNWMGVMGGRRSHIHQKLDESLADLCLVIKPTLTILDAVRILYANGPQGGSLDDVKKLDTIVAGVDQVAVDAYGATLFGMKGSDLGYVRMAAQRGLGEMDLSKLNIRKINT
ncbi:MAG: DUF362 domain-containing protein [Dissulfurispiraceae bacterium]|jgi:uncharacterized protein (DUF362 family)|nr:DUF362 domain-containing protein [Dissulfurispiraceae bacterium]